MKKYYKRKIDEELERWASSNERKPLLLRGARQVGKTSAVKHTPSHQQKNHEPVKQGLTPRAKCQPFFIN